MYDILPSFGLLKRIEWNGMSKSQRNRKDHNGIGCIWVMEIRVILKPSLFFGGMVPTQIITINFVLF